MDRRPPGRPRIDMKRGDIYVVNLEPTQGREQRDKRPVVIVSPDEFNRATELPPVVVPITNGGEFAGRIGFSVPMSGIETTGVVRCDQPRTLDLQARNARTVGVMPDAIMAEVLARVAPIID
jgi:mRNA interferase ChpB